MKHRTVCVPMILYNNISYICIYNPKQLLSSWKLGKVYIVTLKHFNDMNGCCTRKNKSALSLQRRAKKTLWVNQYINMNNATKTQWSYRYLTLHDDKPSSQIEINGDSSMHGLSPDFINTFLNQQKSAVVSKADFCSPFNGNLTYDTQTSYLPWLFVCVSRLQTFTDVLRLVFTKGWGRIDSCLISTNMYVQIPIIQTDQCNDAMCFNICGWWTVNNFSISLFSATLNESFLRDTSKKGSISK